MEIMREVLEAFGLGEASEVAEHSSGHINDTFYITPQNGGKRIVMQRINRFVFPKPEDIIENMVKLTEFLRRKIAESGGDPSRETLTIVETADGRPFFVDSEKNLWRGTFLIENTTAYETVSGPEILEEAGFAFGKFQRMLDDFPASDLHEIIKDFHNTPERYNQLEEAANNDAVGRLKDISEEMSFANARKDYCFLLMNMLRNSELPLRVTHNDTKLSNILIDNDTGKAVCVIDLDTVMPGLIAFDFGDSIRAAATTAAEDEADLSKVSFSLGLFEAYTRGFLKAAEGALTENELITLPDGAIMMTLEVGMRFLADYLNGDIYFKTAYPEHNLVRARNQFKLVSDMERHKEQMLRIIRKYA